MAVEASLEPNAIELTLAPGESAERTVRFRYLAGPAGDVSFALYDFYADASGSTRLVPTDEAARRDQPLPPDFDRWAGAVWVEASGEAGPMRAGEERAFNLKVSVPRDAEPGERHALLLVSLASAPDGGSVSLVPRLGARILVTVPGAQVSRADGLRLGASHRGLLPLGNPVDLVLTFRNSGTVHVHTGGEAVLQNVLGGDPIKVPLPDQRVLPGETARVVGQWAGPPFWILFGRYTVSPAFTDDSLSLLPAEQSFWVVNWGSAGAALVILLGAWAAGSSGVPRRFVLGLRRAGGAFLAGFRAG